jgi:sugar lactone lactonase YvrE
MEGESIHGVRGPARFHFEPALQVKRIFAAVELQTRKLTAFQFAGQSPARYITIYMGNIRMHLRHLRVALVLGCAAVAPLAVRAAPGDLYVVDNSVNGAIFKLTPDGTKSTFATGLVYPEGLAFDTAGNLFVADTNNSQILKFAPDGTKSTFASGLRAPFGLAFDSSGNLFVSDKDTIFKFARDGTKTVFASGLNQPAGLAFDRQGNLFEADFATDTIFKFTADGSTKTRFASVGSLRPFGLAFDSNGNLFMSDGNFDDIFKIAPDGTLSTFAINVSSGGLAFNDKGDLFASSTRTIVKFAADGTRSTFSSGYEQAQFLAFEPIPRQLLNVSARGFVDSGDKVVIAGFIIGGSALANNAVVVRGIGPSLPRAGNVTALQDPVLELHDASGAVIAANDNWQDTQKAQIIATGLAPSDPRESAIFATLPAGNYTAVVRGVNDVAGTALAEVYNVR